MGFAKKEKSTMRLPLLLISLSLSGVTHAADSGSSREQDALCFTAIARNFEATRNGPAHEKKMAEEILRAEPYFAGKVRAAFTDAELPAVLTSADEQMRKDPKRRDYAISCWQIFQIEMMIVTNAAQGKPVK